MAFKKELIEKNLIREVFGLSVYKIDKQSAPKVYMEILRISALQFNIEEASDKFDDTYSYLIAYDYKYNEIVSFYRYVVCNTVIDGNTVNLSTANYYRFTADFISNILSKSIELGRSVNNKEAKINKENPGVGLKAIWKGGLGPLVYNYCLQYYDRKENPPVTNLFGQFSLQKTKYDIDTEAGSEAVMFIFAMFIRNFGVMRRAYRKLIPIHDLYIPNKLDFSIYMAWFDGKYKQDRDILRGILKKSSMLEPKLAFHYGNLDADNNGDIKMYWPVFNDLLQSFEMGLLWNITSISPAYRKMFIGKVSDINLSAFDQ